MIELGIKYKAGWYGQPPFAFTSPATFELPENSEDAVGEIATNREGAEIHLGYPAPAPYIEEITLTPDAVGDNPVTWYFVCVYVGGSVPGEGAFRSLVSIEGEVTVGDDTTELTVSGINFPYWAIGEASLFCNFGLVSGVYTHRRSGNETLGFPFYESPYDFDIYQLKYHSIPGGYQAPAPTNISITPDAVGANPVTWYYAVIQLNLSGQVTEFPEEQSYQQGDDTTELIFDLTHVDYDSVDGFFIAKGTTSGVYTNIVMASFTPPDGFVGIADMQLPFDLLTGADLPVGAETIEGMLSQLPALILYYYDNELFELDDNELKFLSPPDYENPEDLDGDNVYEVFVVASQNGQDIEQVVEVTVTNVIVYIPYEPNGEITELEWGESPAEVGESVEWDSENEQFILQPTSTNNQFFFEDDGVLMYGHYHADEWVIELD